MNLLTEKQVKGVRAELLAQNYLIQKGYLIFPALHNQGPIDIVTLDKDTNHRYFDVKTFAKRKDGTKICRTNKKIPGIKIEILYVNLETGKVSESLLDKVEWHKNYIVSKDEKGLYTGKVLRRDNKIEME